LADEGDIRELHKFGFDSLKLDGCGRMCNMTEYADLMKQTGKNYQIENCHVRSHPITCPSLRPC
jgi:hypothetical protein